MKNIYILESDYQHFSYFLPVKNNMEISIRRKSLHWNWNKPFDYEPVAFQLQKSGTNTKNFNFDISAYSSPFFIISEKTWNILYDILEPRGIKLEIITESKRKKFFAYYPLNVVHENILDLNLSEYSEAANPHYLNQKIIRKPVLKNNLISKDYIFSIKESPSLTFVDENFKKRVEEAELKGFDFSHSVQLS